MDDPAQHRRRAVLSAAAWTVPVVAVAAPAPAFAASPPRFTIVGTLEPDGVFGIFRVRLAFTATPAAVSVTNIAVRYGVLFDLDVSGDRTALTTPGVWNETANAIFVRTGDRIRISFTAAGRNYGPVDLQLPGTVTVSL